eukprot:TRINITY_DN11304_c2_g1_i1.p1 TRINITY_DN11304_c2_g1~~TRINITY_DN11304_c2_g1_i1.p1  ORF type:complete len:448 (+),score=168.19 TRINITY_DN11304_c2_g1_i1:68-1345(+)
MAMVDHALVGDGASTAATHAELSHQDEEIRQLTAKLKDLEAEHAEVMLERKHMEDGHVLMGLQIRKLAKYDRLHNGTLHPDTAARLQDLRNQLALERRQQQSYSRGPGALGLAEEQLQLKIDRRDALREELEHVKERTHWDRAASGPAGHRDYHSMENTLRELKAKLAELKQEQDWQKATTKQKTDRIAELSLQLEQLKNIELRKDELKEELKQKAKEKEDFLDDIKTVRRIHSRKEILMKELQHSHKTRDPQKIRTLESDKRVLQHDIQKLADERRNKDKSLQAQHQRILLLESKLAAIASTLKSFKRAGLADSDPAVLHYRPDVPVGETRVDVALFDQVQAKLEEQRRGLEMKDVLMLDRDTAIQALEKKVDILMHAKSSKLRRLRMEKADMNREREQYQMQYQLAEEEQDRIMQQIKAQGQF